jgi:NADH dehydrogenase
LYEVATAPIELSPAEYGALADGTQVKLKSWSYIFPRANLNVLQATVTGLDLAHRRIHFHDHETLDYDYIIIAVGSQPQFSNIAGLAQNSRTLRNIPEALRIHRRLNELIAAAEHQLHPIRIVVGGAGLAGVEIASQIQAVLNRIITTGKIKNETVTVWLVESSPTILPSHDHWTQTTTAQRLRRLGVKIITGQAIVRVDAQQVILADQPRLDYDLLIWTGGIQANTLLQQLGLSTAGHGQLCVDQYLRLPEHQEITVIGDGIYFLDPVSGRQIPQTAYLATAQGIIAAGNIHRTIRQRQLKPYQPKHLVYTFPVGGRWAISIIGGWRLSGRSGWMVRRIVELDHYLSILSFSSAIKTWWRGGRVYLPKKS